MTCRRGQERRRNGSPDDHSESVPPESIPNSVVKRLSADGSVGSPHVRVGRCQALIPTARAHCVRAVFSSEVHESAWETNVDADRDVLAPSRRGECQAQVTQPAAGHVVDRWIVAVDRALTWRRMPRRGPFSGRNPGFHADPAFAASGRPARSRLVHAAGPRPAPPALGSTNARQPAPPRVDTRFLLCSRCRRRPSRSLRQAAPAPAPDAGPVPRQGARRTGTVEPSTRGPARRRSGSPVEPGNRAACRTATHGASGHDPAPDVDSFALHAGSSGASCAAPAPSTRSPRPRSSNIRVQSASICTRSPSCALRSLTGERLLACMFRSWTPNENAIAK